MSENRFEEGRVNISLHSFVETIKFQLGAFSDTIANQHKLGMLPYYEWLEQFSEFLDAQSEGCDLECDGEDEDN